MKTAVLSLLFLVIGFAASSSGESEWAYVPASRDTRTLAAIEIPYVPSESVVSIVGKNPGSGMQLAEPRGVFSVSIPELAAGRPDEIPRDESNAYAIPKNAHWPDTSGRIVAAKAEDGGASSNAGIRNPWNVRVHTKQVGSETVFECGGIVIGGDCEPIAILNRRVVKRGDALGDFCVSSVFQNGVVLERNGSYFVVPRGKRTTVSTVEG